MNYDHPSSLSIKTSFSTRNLDTRSFPFGDSLKVEFSSHGETFKLDLIPNIELLESAEFYEMSDSNELVLQPTPMIAFKGRNEDTRLTILNFQDQIFEGYTTKGQEVYLFVPAESEQMSPEKRSTLQSSMLVIKLSDIVENEDNPRYCGVKDQDSEHLHSFQTRSFVPAQTNPIPSPCPSSPTKLTLGIVTDDTYENTYSNARSQVISHANQINGVYSAQTNINIALGKVFLGLTESFTTGCSVIEDKLSEFSQWRGKGEASTDKSAGLYALFSTCYQSGTVGLAWIDVSCVTDSYYMSSSGDWFSGTSVSSLVGSGGYLVATHELGHNFGANHDQSGGIMYPSTTGSSSFSRTSQTDVCNGYSENKGNTACFVSVSCQPACSGKECGSNGCGGTCGSCNSGYTCTNSKCELACVPNCEGKQCGANGCGGSCGTCSEGAVCSKDSCLTYDTESDSEVYLTLMNDARDRFNVPHLTWSDTLSSYAQDWAESCIWGSSRGSFGENLAASTSHVKDTSSLVQLWLNEEKNWNCDSNTCSSGTFCGDWTQILWEGTTEVGCFKQFCYGDQGLAPSPTWDYWTFLVCSFNPPGNILGQKPFNSAKCQEGVQCATEESCSDLGYHCGEFVDLCGETIDCGDCSTSTQCSDNICQCVPSTSCRSERRSCGSLDDGCGTLLECGTCSSGQTCKSGYCVCEPKASCEGKTCGTVDDGCGNILNCGDCSGTCTNGVCSEVCQPSSTCKSNGYECGKYNFGCGSVTCGFCSEQQECKEGVCVCKPETCEEAGRECGDFHDGCQRTMCGRCPENRQCIDGICSTCSSCHEYANCTNSVCKCLPGYVGDGFNCEAQSDVSEPSSPLGNWEVVEGDTNDHLNWRNTGQVLVFEGNSNHDSTIYWKDVQNLPYSSTRKFSVKVQRHQGNQNIGFVYNAVDGFNVFVRWEKKDDQNNGEWKLGWKYSESWGETSFNYWTKYTLDFVDYYGNPISFSQNIPLDTWIIMTLTIQGYSLIIDADNKIHTMGVDSTKLVDSGLGLTASGPCSFSDVTLVTNTEIYITLRECVDESSLRNQIAGVLNIYPQLILVHPITCVKRQAGPIVATVALSSVSNGPSSVALASQLQAMISSGHPLIGGSGLSATSASMVTPATPAGVPTATIPSTLPSGSGGGSSSGVSSGVVAAIVLASLASLGVIVGSVLFYMKKHQGDHLYAHQELNEFEGDGETNNLTQSEDSHSNNVLFASDSFETESNKSQSSFKPKGGVDVLGFASRPEDITSITARAPATIKKYPS